MVLPSTSNLLTRFSASHVKKRDAGGKVAPEELLSSPVGMPAPAVPSTHSPKIKDGIFNQGPCSSYLQNVLEELHIRGGSKNAFTVVRRLQRFRCVWKETAGDLQIEIGVLTTFLKVDGRAASEAQPVASAECWPAFSNSSLQYRDRKVGSKKRNAYPLQNEEEPKLQIRDHVQSSSLSFIPSTLQRTASSTRSSSTRPRPRSSTSTARKT
jgi:hypothetical protein